MFQRRVLLVEDNIDKFVLVASLFERAGFLVLDTHGG